MASSSFEFELDLSKFASMFDSAAEVIEKAARTGMHDALDEWKADAVDVAPIEEGTLRQTISVGDINGAGLNLSGSVSANAVVKSRSGRRFNYAYYIHEANAGDKRLRTPGTVKRFLEVPLKKNEAKWQADIEREIQTGLDGAGW
ncbi:HK97 gp10 family phage protein [Cohnella silvisoli]|uniref:HK97 gp10 family phage protein n=1 Tax=Cohnella silvisoli TaxID=2873699 RepID=A0ABV1KZ15_9BACL|nr:HK97 gp10 family phage protein [Cohnella silvisoli]MCD9024317.1 HK97 gp10 family phage protein [Cohnella silvisoli]